VVDTYEWAVGWVEGLYLYHMHHRTMNPALTAFHTAYKMPWVYFIIFGLIGQASVQLRSR
jgi:hypothetical protein